MSKLLKNRLNKSLINYYIIIIGCLLSDKCINCWSLQDSVAAAYTSAHSDQIELNFSILEGVPIGTLIGVIKSSNSSIITQPPYLIVPVPGVHKTNSSHRSGANTGYGGVDTDLNIDQSTCEIRTAVQLDREQRSSYEFIAIPLTGANIKVTITIEDINDNSPQFPTDEIEIEFPENSKPRDVKRTLPPARDFDLGQFGTQKYRIVSGNIGNAFRLLSHREKDDVLYLDLQVNGPLDRETISNYTLVIEALDGGQPQLRDEMTVKISILDHNDCEPVFSQNHYYGNIAENATIGTSLLRVTATDNDQGDNGLITYSIHSKNSTLSGLSTNFGINKINGWIFVAKPLDFESKELHELVVIARDSGAQPLETSAFVSIRVIDINDNQPTIGLLFLTESARPEIAENARVGDLVARVSVNDADSSDSSTHSESNGETMTGLTVSLAGGDGNFGLTTHDNIVYLIIVTGLLDRHKKSNYRLTVIVTDQGNPPLNTTTSFELQVMAINEKPIENETYRPTLPEVTDIGGTVFRAKPRNNIELIHKKFDKFMNETTDTHSINVIESTPIGQQIGSFDIPLTKNNEVIENCRNGFYTFYNSGEESIPFLIDSHNGLNLKLILSNQLNFETKDKYNLIVCIDSDQCSLYLINGEEVIRGTKICKQYIKFNINVVDDESDCSPFPMDSKSDSYEIKIPLNNINKYRRLTDVLYLNSTKCQNIKYEISSPVISDDILKRLFILNANALQFRPFDQSVIQKLLHEEFVMTLTAKKGEQHFRSVAIRVRLLSADKRIGNIGFISDKYVEMEEDCCKVGSNILQLRINVSHEDFIIKYEFNDYNDVNTDFILNSETGFLSLNRELDYERRQEYKLNVTAFVSDTKGLLISVSTIITIKVLNSNDESPVFVRKIYEKEVPENVSPDVLLLQIEAKDNDDFGYSNLTYLIPEGFQFSDYFNLNKRSGELRLIKQLDREERQSFNIPIYAFDENFKHYAQTFARIKLIDVNDNTPYFLNTNYEIKIPESIVPGTLFHTFIALDKDGSATSKVALNYRILSGNTANKFSLHPAKGELSTNAALDREKQNIYHLVVEVSDSIHSSNCNLTIELSDVNDNAPIFDKTNYYAIIDNTITGYTNVVTVRAIDSDGDPVLYSINITNEFDSYFFIDSKTGEITVHTPSLTFLSKAYNSNVFIFNVLATEVGTGAYESHTSKATVHVTLLNNGHNLMPKLKNYPYVITLSASKNEYRVSTEIGSIELIDGHSIQTENIIYRVVSSGDGHQSFMDYFNIHSQSGAIVVKRPLNHDYYEAIIEVSKSPNSHLATRSLLQVFVGEEVNVKNVKQIQFKVELNENIAVGTEVINLGIKSRTFGQNYVYTFAYSSVNYSYFSLNQKTGGITLEELLDYESMPSIIEVIVFGRKTLNSFDSYYFNVTIELINVDDNAPQFTQKHYISSIKEGEPTGSFVAQISAIDIDNNKQTNSGRKPVTYHILEGNHDNAFTIDPPGSGIIRTNTVLDREIRDHYFLKIVANYADNSDNSQTSESQTNFQLSSHCTLEIIVIDVNDNVPVFPPNQEISIYDTEEVGAVITTLTANDVDTFPMLTYQKQRTNNLSESTELFDIGLYSGKITLKSRLSETISKSLENRYVLNIASSDSKHTVKTQIVINVKRRDSQQKPIFTNESNFFVKIDSEDNNCVLHSINCDIFRVITHENKNVNQKVIYSLGSDSGQYGFYIDKYRGIIYNNKTLKFRNSKIFNLIVYAKYLGNEEQSQASLIIRVLGTSNYPENKKDRIFNVETDLSQIGRTTLTLPKMNKNYVITGGNANENFVILRGNELILTKKPLKDEYSLKITPNNDIKNNSILVNVKIKSLNEEKTSYNAFKSTIFDVHINENEPIGTEVQNLKPITNYNKIKYKIFSGNEMSDFRIDENNGIIYVNHLLNFESINKYRLGVVAEVYLTDSETIFSFAIININVINVNEYCPQFPISHYKAIVDENVSIGTKVIKLKAFDLDNDLLNYTVIKLSDTIIPFTYDKRSGYLVTTDQIDYESIDVSPPVYKLLIRAMDSGVGLIDCTQAETLLEIQIGSVDEYSPVFTSESYSFKGIATNGGQQIKVGQVLATDADSGPDGRIVYTLRSTSPTNLIEYFTVNSSSGTVSMTTTGLDSQRHFSLIVSASSGRPNSMNALVVVDVNLSIVSEGSELSGIIKSEDNSSVSTANPTSLPGWILFLIVLLMLITVVLLVSIVVIRLHQHQQQQHLMSDHVRHIGPHNIGSLLRKIGTFGGTDPNLATYQPHHTSHYGSAPPVPPCYNDVTLSSSGALASGVNGVGGEGHSASSGRGSAEEEEVEEDIDDVDEEIRMINENSNYYGEDGDSDVTTTAEYLARLGVINHHEEDREESSTALEDEEEDDVMLEQLGAISTPRISSIRGQNRGRITSTLKSDDWPQMSGSMSSIVQSEEELSGSYNWDYLQNWGPKYQPLSSVFAEIARLKATNGEHDLSAVEAMAVECGSTRSSSTTSSSQRVSHRHQMTPQITSRTVLSVHPTPTFTPQINSAFQPFNPLNSLSNIENHDINNGLTVDEEFRI